MSGYSGQTPDTERAADWRDKASCRGEDSEIFFASSQTAAGQADIRHAKVICFGCPVKQACGQWAIETRQPFGVWGGMSEVERRGILRRRGILLIADDEPDEPRTFATLYRDRTTSLDDGHIGWTGAVPVHCHGAYHTPAQISFRLDRGRAAVGIVRRTCDREGCVLAAHLWDQRERDAAQLSAKAAVS